MKTLFAILFFIATGLLVCLFYLFLQMIDMSSKPGFVILDFVGILASIILLVFLLRNYIKLPSDNGPNKS
ncbi:MAG TPA: hypothetical protein VGZ90_04160 [Puia sp.]|jgi:hypothetical protein|nr:hypothetical protein [Puia sp.]